VPDPDPDLGSHTGLYSVNRETPVASLLADAVTPTRLHYVRNHGAVPALDWATHRLAFSLEPPSQDKPTPLHELAMDELRKRFPRHEVTVTMACDGNRRRELNEIRHTQGYDWGPAAVGTARWGGARLADVLRAVVPPDVLQRFIDAGGHVHFEGADALPQGSYGTSLPLTWALDPAAEALLAYTMNGAPLPPHHGFPVRTILPGCVGGRTVKWLRCITLAARPSRNWYHMHDNRVLPPHVTSIAQAAAYWPTPHGVLYEMNLNAVLLQPGHDAAVPMPDVTAPCMLAGIAYDGGGRAILRVETSIDDGATWDPCELQRGNGECDEAERRTAGGRSWVLCRWTTAYPLWRLAGAREVVVRAWNSSCNTQPERPTWNLLGMLNNSWYRVRLQREDAGHLRFLHPVRTGTPGGAERRQLAGARPGWQERPPRTFVEEVVPNRTFAWPEIRKHTARDDCWVVIEGKVYDLTEFAAQHPAGAGPILAHAGTDVTELFTAIHSYDAHVLKAAYVLGHAAAHDAVPARHVSERPKQPLLTPDGHRVVVTPRRWTAVRLLRKERVTHDTCRFTFALPDRSDRMWLPPGRHLDLGIVVQRNRLVVRPYTPVRPVLPAEEDGTFDLVIKIYFPTEAHPGGEMTTLLEALQPGDMVRAKGPEGYIAYAGHGCFDVLGHFLHCTKLNLVVGGTGITPALAVIRAVLLGEADDDEARLEVRLVYANKTADDIICADELHALEARAPDRLCVYHVLSRVGDGTPRDRDAVRRVMGDRTYGTGYVDEAILREHCFPPAADTACFLCGPPAMVSHAVMPALDALGFDDDHVFEF